MRYTNVVISTGAPKRGGLWAKPVEGGFALYLLHAGKWQPLKLVSDGETSLISDDEVLDLESKIVNAFTIGVTTSKTGASDSDITAMVTALKSAMGMDFYGLMSEGPINFDFHPVTDKGNLTISGPKFAGETPITIVAGENSDPDTVSMGKFTITKTHPTYKTPALEALFKALLEGLTASVVEAVLDDRAAVEE